MKRLLSLIAVCTILTGLAVSAVSASGFGVTSKNPLEELKLRPGVTYRREIIISRSTPEEDINIEVTAELGDQSDWVTFEPGSEFTIPAGEGNYSFFARIAVPNDANLQDYGGVIRIQGTSPNPEVTNGGVSVANSVALKVSMAISNEVVEDMKVRNILIDDVEVGDPILVEMLVENTGNIDIAPTNLQLSVLNLNSESIAELETSDIDKVSPGDTETVTARLSNTLEKGEYFGVVRVYNEDLLLREERLAFKVVDQVEEETTGTTEAGKSTGSSTQTILLVGGAVLAIIIILVVVLAAAKKDNSKAESSSVSSDKPMDSNNS